MAKTHSYRARRWTQFSLRGLLIATLIVSLYLGYRVSQPVQQRNAVSDFSGRGATIGYQKGEPNALQRLLGPDYSGVVDYIDLFGTEVGDEELVHLDALSNVRQLRLPGTKITNNGLRHVRHLKDLEWLDLCATNISDEGMEHLVGLGKLERLHLTDTKVGDLGVARLAHLPNLQTLGLNGTNVTDACLQHLAGLNSLTALHLGNTAVSDAGIEAIAEIPNLTTLTLRGRTGVSETGVEQLKQLKPNLEVYR